MKPVFQDSFGFGNGNCAWACVASIFELSVADAQGVFGPPCAEDLQLWTKMKMPELRFNNHDLGYDYVIVDGFPDCEGVGTGRWSHKTLDEWDPPDASATDGYWMGTVPSQRLTRPVCDPYYPLPALHAVVMRGRVCVHDPNPKNRLVPFPRMLELSWWTNGDTP